MSLGKSMRLVGILFLISTTACQAILSEQIQSTADEKTLFEEVFKNPDKHTGKIIILGGEIRKLRYQEEKTEIEFVEIPLYKGGHLALGFDPGEIFFVLFPERLDPILIKRGKVLTLAGRVIGTRTLEGKNYPLFAYEEAYVWDKLRQDRFPSFGAFFGNG
ncbi:MAG: Slp family lipoprotein [Nitrospira sp.]